ncbi:MAG: ABC transporter ATP-binding protein/permease [Dysgonamonadaceae bacterium]|jgi:ABC-type bacteriocin/lantibiotic exporter with double-glycine peptidase domain|nr:ABC transporter ATP-binding protein/permease [Dysgonamonadaceae bacterium]
MKIRELLGLIPPAYRKQGVWVVVSVVSRALLNMAGLTALISLIALLFDPGNSAIALRLAAHREAVAIAVFAFVLVKNFLVIHLRSLQIRYINRLFQSYAGRLYEGYYRQGLLFVKNEQPDTLAYNVNAVSYLFTHGLVSLSFTMAGEILLLLLIWGGILCYSPLMALLIVGCLIPFVIVYVYGVRRKLSDYGKMENEAKRKLMTLVGDTFRGYTGVKLNDAWPWFRKRFDLQLLQIARCRELIDRALRIPEGMMECYAAAGLILFVLLSGNNVESQVTFGILAVAVLRMLPSVRTLITLSTQWKNNAFTIETIRNLPKAEEQETAARPVCFRDRIEVEQVGFRYPQSKDEVGFVLKNFSLTIRKGECIGIQGISGIGKTTLLNLLLGFYAPQAGKITIDGLPLDASTCESWFRKVAYVPQDLFIMDGSLAENIAFGCEEIDKARAEEAIRQASLQVFIDSLPEGIQTKIGANGCRLSGGQRQRLGIARALYKQAEVLFLDEAVSALDPQTEQEIAHTLQTLMQIRHDLTLVVIAHNDAFIAFCHRIIRL